MSAVTTSLQGQSQDETGPQPPIQLIYADSLVGTSADQNTIREFIGNVKFTQGNVTVTCNRAVQDLANNQVELFGKVVIRQEALKISAPHVIYSGSNNVARADGGVKITDANVTASSERLIYDVRSRDARLIDSVVIVDDSTKIWADSGLYNRNNKNSTAWGRVVVVGSNGTSVVRADTVFNYPSAQHSIAKGHAIVWKINVGAEESPADTTVIQARTIEKFDVPAVKYVAAGDVEIVNKTTAARADSSIFHSDNESVLLFGNPFLWSAATKLKADMIRSIAVNSSLSDVDGIGHAFLLSVGDSSLPERVDQVSADSILIKFENDTINSLKAIGNARSINFHSENESGDGLVQFSSDTITAKFISGGPRDIYWLGSVHGEHHPENLARGKAETFRLQDFPDIPKKPMRLHVEYGRDVLILPNP